MSPGKENLKTLLHLDGYLENGSFKSGNQVLGILSAQAVKLTIKCDEFRRKEF
jgi:hypothetical protein